MLSTVENLKKYGVPIDTLNYRGFKVNLYEDIQGKQLVAIWQDQLYELGTNNTVYQDDLKMLIDEHLDTISRFENYPELKGSKLEYFQNSDFRDIRLSYRGRLLKIYLLKGEVNINALKQDALNALLRYKTENALS